MFETEAPQLACKIELIVLVLGSSSEQTCESIAPRFDTVPDYAFSASSSVTSYHGPDRSRLYSRYPEGSSAWCARHNTVGEFIQVSRLQHLFSQIPKK